MKKSNFTLSYIILWVYSLFTLFNLFYIIYNSFRTKEDFISNTLGIPKSLGIENYIKLFVEDKFYLNLISSIIILVFTLLITIVLSTMVAYGIGRYEFRFKKIVRMFFLVGLMFPTQLGIIPIFIMVRNLGLINTYWGVILVQSSALSLPVLLLTIFFTQIPQSFYEAAKVDGASEFRIFFSIMLPLAKPVISSVSIIMSVQIWKQFFIPLIFLQEESLKTAPLAIMRYTGSILRSADLALASSVITAVPLLIVFFIFSKKILENITTGGIKE